MLNQWNYSKALSGTHQCGMQGVCICRVHNMFGILGPVGWSSRHCKGLYADRGAIRLAIVTTVVASRQFTDQEVQVMEGTVIKGVVLSGHKLGLNQLGLSHHGGVG